MRRLSALAVALLVFGWLGPVLLSVNLRTPPPYSVTVSPRVSSAPVVITVRVRVDTERLTRGAMCVIVAGAEDHNSCWNVDELNTPLVVRRFNLESPGDYDVVVNGPAGLTPAVSVLLQ